MKTICKKGFLTPMKASLYHKLFVCGITAISKKSKFVARIERHYEQQNKIKKDTKLKFFQNEKLRTNPYAH